MLVIINVFSLLFFEAISGSSIYKQKHYGEYRDILTKKILKAKLLVLSYMPMSGCIFHTPVTERLSRP